MRARGARRLRWGYGGSAACRATSASTTAAPGGEELFVDYAGEDFTILGGCPCAGEGADIGQLPALP